MLVWYWNINLYLLVWHNSIKLDNLLSFMFLVVVVVVVVSINCIWDLTSWPCCHAGIECLQLELSPYTIRKLYETTVSRLWTEKAPDCDSWEMETKEVCSPIALALCLKAISEIQGQGASTQKEPGILTKLRDNWHLGRLRQLEL